MDDHALLREYLEHHSEKAFSELVDRYLPLVYGTALRLVGDTHAAQDMVQAVFIQLARKAWTIRNGHALPGWLYRATHHAAYAARRSEIRRRERETAAMNLAEQNQPANTIAEQIAPLLDDALAGLSRVEQDAVLLRYFQDKSFREVGATLGLNEEAARKRTDRALDKIRLHFSRRGITATAALLGSALTSQAATPPPMGLATKVAASTFAHTAGTHFGTLLWKAFLMNTQTKIITTAVVVALVAAIPIAYQQQEINKLNATVTKLSQASRSRVAALPTKTTPAPQIANSGANGAAQENATQTKATANLSPDELAALLQGSHAAEGYASDITGNLDFANIALRIARKWAADDPQGAVTWAQGLPAGSGHDDAMKLIFTLYAEKDFAAALSLAQALPADGNARSLALQGLAKTAVPVSVQDPAKAAAILESLGADEPSVSADNPTALVAMSWYMRDPTAAINWVNTMSAGNSKDSAILTVAAVQQDTDPAAAFTMLRTMVNASKRGAATSALVSVWAKTDPDAAANAVMQAYPNNNNGRRAALLDIINQNAPKSQAATQ